MRILVAEDEPLIAYCLASELERAGHTVIGPAHFSAEALACSRALAPQLALVDIDLESNLTGLFQRTEEGVDHFQP